MLRFRLRLEFDQADFDDVTHRHVFEMVKFASGVIGTIAKGFLGVAVVQATLAAVGLYVGAVVFSLGYRLLTQSMPDAQKAEV